MLVFQKWKLGRDIHAVIIDADDTLFDTLNYFNKHVRLYASYLSSLSGKKFDEVYELMFEVLDVLRPVYSVHSTIVAESARITALSCGIDFYDSSVQEQYGELMSLYKKSPEMFLGVRDVLEELKNTGLSLVLFTHSSREWAEKKVRDNDLGNLFTFTVSPFERKNGDSLEEVIERLKIKPSQALVFGDSWMNDIRPAVENGIPKTNIFRIHTDYSHANMGKIEGVTEIESFNQLPETIIKNF